MAILEHDEICKDEARPSEKYILTIKGASKFLMESSIEKYIHL